MRSWKQPAAIAVVGLLWVGAVASTQKTPSSPEEAAIVPPIPEEAKRVENPVAPTDASIENGRKIYSSQCTMCHGANGDGKGDLVERLGLTMPDLTSREQASKRSDGEWFYVITHGHGRMRGEGARLSDETKWDMINFLRSLSR